MSVSPTAPFWGGITAGKQTKATSRGLLNAQLRALLCALRQPPFLGYFPPLSGNLSSFLCGFELLREGVDLASFSPTGYCG